jgi:hypothetical protein
MQRSNWCLALLAAGLVLVVGLSVSEAGPRKSRKAAKEPPAPAVQQQTAAGVEVDGIGRDAREARKHALEHAVERVTELLRAEAGDPTWQPPAAVLAPEFLDFHKVAAEVGKPERDAKVRVEGDETWTARYKVQLTDPYLREVQKQARQERVSERHLFLVRVLGGLLAVLLVTAGYLRLEEMTRGYATKLLRLAAFIVLALAGVAIWLTMP